MLLSNMTKYEPTCVRVLEGEAKPLPGLSESTRLLDHLVEAFHRGHKRAYNPKAEFNFLASVFANVSGVSTNRLDIHSFISIDIPGSRSVLVVFTFWRMQLTTSLHH